MSYIVKCKKCLQNFKINDEINHLQCKCPNCQTQSLQIVRDNEEIRTTGSIVGGAILGASLGGFVGAIIGGFTGIFLSDLKNKTIRKGDNNG